MTELSEILKGFQVICETSDHNSLNKSKCDRLMRYICLDTILTLHIKVLFESKIKALEKGLNFALNLRKIHKLKFRRDFQEFWRSMRIKQNF